MRMPLRADAAARVLRVAVGSIDPSLLRASALCTRVPL
jgi:hypothetical protein